MQKLYQLLNSDKAKHMLYCFFITSMFSLFNIYIGIAIASAFAIAKEVYDIQRRGFELDNILDLLAGALGVILAWIVLM